MFCSLESNVSLYVFSSEIVVLAGDLAAVSVGLQASEVEDVVKNIG